MNRLGIIPVAPKALSTIEIGEELNYWREETARQRALNAEFPFMPRSPAFGVYMADVTDDDVDNTTTFS